MRTEKSMIFKVIIFILGGLIIGGCLQNILIVKLRYPDRTLNENSDRILTGFYEEEEESISVIALGVSHMNYGFSPMELYETYGITSYNLATAAQPMPMSFFMLKEALQTQTPDVIIVDVDSLYFDKTILSDEKNWRYVLNQMALNENKVEAAIELSNYNDEQDIIGVLFPILRYHERWQYLTREDFTDWFKNRKYYCKGYNLATIKISMSKTEDLINDEMDKLISDTEAIEEGYLLGEYFERTYENPLLYEKEIMEDNIEWLKKIKWLCDVNGIQLLLVKIPSGGSILENSSTWTVEKSNQIKEMCNEEGYNFFDIMYDSGIQINWSTDSTDGAKHLNMLGAQKVTKCLGKYISDNYNVPIRKTENWDKSLELYNKVRKVAALELEYRLPDYIAKLENDFSDKVIFIAASGDMTVGLTEEDKAALLNLGLQTDFSNGFRKSYIAVIDNGNIVYECLSNRRITYEGKTETNEKNYNILSSGYYVGGKASICINGIDYAINGGGINIVVYDDELDMVLDRVCFDTYKSNYAVQKSNWYMWEDFRKYENYIIEVEDR